MPTLALPSFFSSAFLFFGTLRDAMCLWSEGKAFEEMGWCICFLSFLWITWYGFIGSKLFSVFGSSNIALHKICLFSIGFISLAYALEAARS